MYHLEEPTSLQKKRRGAAHQLPRAAHLPSLTSLPCASELDETAAVEGILNGTTNYMLSRRRPPARITRPRRPQRELAYAMAVGTPPQMISTRCKIVLSADLAFGVNIRKMRHPLCSVSRPLRGRHRCEGRGPDLQVDCPSGKRPCRGRVRLPDAFLSAPRRYTDGTGNLVTLLIAFWQAELFRRGRRRLPDRLERAARSSPDVADGRRQLLCYLSPLLGEPIRHAVQVAVCRSGRILYLGECSARERCSTPMNLT